ncbi:16S rRNA (cytidine(1402)-2'-O)-methyltransferase [Rhodovulum sp. DZ06]|uniref:16S rRNA (cytidine(1402)-2'-O)-methyltransferase n=1 Tax=Rhodovulum sp. DZ06 TaxID=3425126 RepID=UPI003D33FAA2
MKSEEEGETAAGPGAGPVRNSPAPGADAAEALGDEGETGGADSPDAGGPLEPWLASAARRGKVPPGLHLVATPIGNAGDITLRALDVLARADVLAAEDTRTLRKLMEIHGIPLKGRPLVAYNDRNGAARRPQIMQILREGKSVAYASDAGTPLVSDPGWKLAAGAVEEDLPLTAAPGPSAALAALCLSGLPSDRFLFNGFLPPKAGARRRALEELAPVPATLIFFESPRRAAATLAEMAEALGEDREAAFCRELTKRFEEVRRGTLRALADAFAAGDPPRGEAVIVVGPPGERKADAADVDALLTDALARMSVKDAAREVAAATGLKRADLYTRALALRDEER